MILDKAIEVGADAIGLSALLVSTSKQMPLCLHELDARGLRLPGADRRRGDQPLVRPAHLAPRGRPAVRGRRLLLQGRLRGARHDRAAAHARRQRPGCAPSARQEADKYLRRGVAGARRAARRRAGPARRPAARSRAVGAVPRRPRGRRRPDRRRLGRHGPEDAVQVELGRARTRAARSSTSWCATDFEPRRLRMQEEGVDAAAGCGRAACTASVFGKNSFRFRPMPALLEYLRQHWDRGCGGNRPGSVAPVPLPATRS